MDSYFMKSFGMKPNVKKETPVNPDKLGVYHITIDTSKQDKGWLDMLSYDNIINRPIYEKFVKDITRVPETAPLKLHLHSFGGNAFYSIKIAQYIKQRTGPSTAVVKDYAMSGATLIALMCDNIEMSKTACLGAIDLQMWLGPVNCILPAAKRWKDKSMIADLFTEFLDKKQASTLKTYEYLLQTKYSAPDVQQIIEFFYTKHDHEKPLFFDDLKSCSCISVSLMDAAKSTPIDPKQYVNLDSGSDTESEEDFDSVSIRGMNRFDS